MPTLLEVQRVVRNRLIGCDGGEAAALLAAGSSVNRLDIYRNAVVLGLTKALQLNFPAVRRLVGDEFFDGAAHLFIADHPPSAAYLDQYGDEFPKFLRDFAPAAALAYLADTARLEWAVNCALHAPDAPSLDLQELASLAPADYGQVRLVAHPAVGVLRVNYPADRIWRAVLSGDDDALAALDVDQAPVNLLVERRETGVEVERLDEAAWRLLAQLCAGCPLQSALEVVEGSDASIELAEHLAHGRFVGFSVAGAERTASGAGHVQ